MVIKLIGRHSSRHLNEWGKTKGKRFVVIHHSILSEGINVNGLEAVLFMRNMDYIGISQTIGRVIKPKEFGLVVVPVFDNGWYHNQQKSAGSC